MDTLDELIAACQTEETESAHASDLQELKVSWRLYNETGFELKARQLKSKLLLARAKQNLRKPILFKRPSFHVSIHNFPRYPLETVHDARKSLDAKLWVYEVEPRVFKGNVPAPILTTAFEAKKLGFKPYVWFVSSETEIQKFLNQPVVKADPALVAYPIVANEGGIDVVDYMFGIVLGLWGKDIEEISDTLGNVVHAKVQA